jgi:hypothetical protein
MRKGYADYYKHGDFNAICDSCLFKFKGSELRKQWDGQMVCKDCFEERHPQDSLRPRPERNKLPWTRPEPESQYITVAEIDTSKL